MAVLFKTQSKISKVFSRMQMIINEFFEKGYYFSWKLAVYNTAWWIGNYCHPLVCLQFWGKKKITDWMDDYIDDNQIYPLDEVYNNGNKSIVNKYRIWVFWWQGEEMMPELVKGCYSQLCLHNRNVVLITKDNVKQYCNIPNYIYDRVENGDISFTHLSDILRVSLLAEHGGLWIDSTCWIEHVEFDRLKQLTFISPKTINAPASCGWNNAHWCCWCMGTNMKNNPLFVFTRDFFFKFFKSHARFPFYLFQDYLYDYAYRRIPEIREMIDNNPENNVGWAKLHYQLNSPWNQQEYEQMTKDNWVFKLSYKTIWKTTCNGQPTFYAKLLSQHTSPTI